MVISIVALVVRRSWLELRKRESALHDGRGETEDHALEGIGQGTMVRLLPPMSIEQAANRIKSAHQEIWSLQISGSEFTANSSETYETWLSTDANRHLLIAFANPANSELLSNIVKLSGDVSATDPLRAHEHLRSEIQASLERYVALRDRFVGQVDLRVYDFSPSYSVHAIDPDGKGDPDGSLFVELYLLDLPQSERPCMLLPHGHAAYFRYRTRSLAWFEAAKEF